MFFAILGKGTSLRRYRTRIMAPRASGFPLPSDDGDDGDADVGATVVLLLEASFLTPSGSRGQGRRGAPAYGCPDLEAEQTEDGPSREENGEKGRVVLGAAVPETGEESGCKERDRDVEAWRGATIARKDQIVGRRKRTFGGRRRCVVPRACVALGLAHVGARGTKEVSVRAIEQGMTDKHNHPNRFSLIGGM